MSRLERNNAAAMKAGQFAHDNASPDDSQEFLETSEGQNWISSAANDLIFGYALKIGGVVVVDPWQLGEKLTAIALAKREEFEDGELEQMIAFVVAGKIDEAQRALYRLIGKDTINEVAEGLCAPLADEYVESMQDEDDK